MEVEQRGGDVLEIVQTREISARTWRDLGHPWQRVTWREGGGALHSTSFHLCCSFAAFLTLSILMAVKALNAVAPAEAAA